ncbi:FHA domain-containing protein [Synechococcus sp. PCC 6312]|uniref:FHA domain-containing protein n=1 Tax=Synechococcus sp. (strain ATCC 27167 / PCC 6312) TaxID=195253 RepID=UPI00029EC7A1|nr:FHA domain-containing protein [Synechococcus sp. PCC 6312]AFY61505.1 FHA domain-containing protein [Synechococcus sp. PCC 6312]
MSQPATEHHVLIIQDLKGKRTLHLQSATYSIGRDKSNAIVVEAPDISRQHALLLRLPKQGGDGYHYRLVDGNARGRLSANGVFVNGTRSKTHNLLHGDQIRLGSDVKIAYEVLTMAKAEFIRYLEQIRFQSIKSIPLTGTETLVGEPFEVDPTVVRKDTSLPPPPVVTLVEPSPDVSSPSLSKYWLVGVGGIAAGVVLGSLLIWALSQSAPPSPQPSAPPSSFHFFKSSTT